MKTAITNARVFDGHQLSEPDTVVIDGEQLGTDPTGADVVDAAGGALLPGLIDTHVHLLGNDEMRTATRAGVTTLVELGTHPDELVQRLRAEHGVCDLLSAGSAASAPGSTQISLMGFPAESGVTGPDDAERYIAWRVSAGADLIKIIIEDPDATDVPALCPETLTALVTAAHERSLRTVAHVVTAAAFDRGLDAGIDILTHAPLDAPLPEQTAQRMADTGTIASPTLVMMRGIARARLGEHADTAFSSAMESVRRMHTAGVRIITGTDANASPASPAPVPHGSSLHDELTLLRESGLTSIESLAAATSGAAAALRLTDRGHIANGQRADLLLTDGNPLQDPATARNPAAVWVAGQRTV